MTDHITEVQIIAEQEDIDAFLEELDDVDNDLALLIFRASIRNAPSDPDEYRAKVERMVGSPVRVRLAKDPELESYKWRMSVTLTLVHFRFLLPEMICVAALFGFETGVWLVDPETGSKDYVDLEVSRRF